MPLSFTYTARVSRVWPAWLVSRHTSTAYSSGRPSAGALQLSTGASPTPETAVVAGAPLTSTLRGGLKYGASGPLIIEVGVHVATRAGCRTAAAPGAWVRTAYEVP